MEDIYASTGFIKPDKNAPFPNTTRLQQLVAQRQQELLHEKQEKTRNDISKILQLYDPKDILEKCQEKALLLEKKLIIPFPTDVTEVGDPDYVKLLMSGSLAGKSLHNMSGVDCGIVCLKNILGIQSIIFNNDTLEIEISW